MADKSQNKFVVLRIAKLKSALSIMASSQHNLREVTPKNADIDRAHLNENLYGDVTKTSKEIFDLAHYRVHLADKVDAKSTPVVEYVISASAAQMAKPEFDDGAFFRDALRWIEEKHGKDNVISANIHRDELEPHLHVHIVPIILREAGTRKQNVVTGKDSAGKQTRETRIIPTAARTEVSANHYFGGPGKCSAMQTDFAEQVGVKHGLVRGIQRYKPGEPYEKVDYQRTETWWREQDALRREYEALKADLDAGMVKLGEDQKAVGRDWSILARAKADRDQRDMALNGREDVVAGKESVVKDREAAADQRDQVQDQRGLAQDKTKIELTDLSNDIRYMHNKNVEGEKKLNQEKAELNQEKAELNQEKAEWALVTEGVKPPEFKKALAIAKQQGQRR
jgi:hypothetical protein